MYVNGVPDGQIMGVTHIEFQVGELDGEIVGIVDAA